MNNTSNFLFGATERELVTLSMAEILDGLMADYKSFSQGVSAGIRIPDKKQELRMVHSSILYAEGIRLAHTHLELAKKLILASLFDYSDQICYWFALKEKIDKENEEKGIKEKFDILEAITSLRHTNTRGFEWLNANEEVGRLEDLLKAIKDFEDYKAEKRRKEE